MANEALVFRQVKLRNEVFNAMRRVEQALKTGQDADREDLVVIRGSSEAFAYNTEEFLEGYTYE